MTRAHLTPAARAKAQVAILRARLARQQAARDAANTTATNLAATVDATQARLNWALTSPDIDLEEKETT